MSVILALLLSSSLFLCSQSRDCDQVHPVGFSRYHLTGPKQGEMDIFAENLPGWPDNIRRSGRGTYWVGMASIRRAEQFSLLDMASTRPWIRALIAKVIFKRLSCFHSSLSSLSHCGLIHGLQSEIGLFFWLLFFGLGFSVLPSTSIWGSYSKTFTHHYKIPLAHSFTRLCDFFVCLHVPPALYFFSPWSQYTHLCS